MKPLKNATHIGTISTDGSEKEVWLRETPKTWTDGRRRWQKFNRSGEPIINPSWQRYPYDFTCTTLLTASIRPLTDADRRVPLAAARREAAAFYQAAVKAAVEAQARVETRAAELELAERELELFDKKHGASQGK